MASNYLLDTNIFSYIAKGISPAARAEFQRLSKSRDTHLFISAVTEAEVRYSMARQILEWGSFEAAVYADLRAKLVVRGITVSAMDLFIASQAIAAKAVLVTGDKIFERVAEGAGLATVNWATDILV